MAHAVSKSKLKKGARAAEEFDFKDFPLTQSAFPPKCMIMHPDSIKTPFSKEQRSRIAKLAEIVSEMDSTWGESLMQIERDIWPEKDILLWEAVVSSYELVLQRRKMKVKPITRNERLRILRGCYKFFVADFGPPEKMQLERPIFDSCQATYEERKDALQEAVNKTKALLALAEFCTFCKKVNVGLRLCGRCKAARYCSEICQREHWKRKEGGHKKVCNAVHRGELKPENVPRMKNKTVVPMHAVNALVPAFFAVPELV